MSVRDPVPGPTFVPKETVVASEKSGEVAYSSESDGSVAHGQPHPSTVHDRTASPSLPLSIARIETDGAIGAGGSSPKRRTASTAALVAISAAESARS